MIRPPHTSTQQRHHSNNGLLFLLSLFLFHCLPRVSSTVFTYKSNHPHDHTQNNNNTTTSIDTTMMGYPSLPAMFGHPLQFDHLYKDVQLIFLPDNPTLCQNNIILYSNNNRTQEVDNDPNNNVVVVWPDHPMVMLASRGECSFLQKAATAQSYSKNVIALIVYNNNQENEDALFPMYSTTTTTTSNNYDTPNINDIHIMLLSVSHRTGQELKRYIVSQLQNYNNSIPLVAFDGNEPAIALLDDLQNVLLSAMGLFFLMVSFSACMVIFLSLVTRLTHPDIHHNHNQSIFRLNEHGHLTFSRRLLTEAQVQTMLVSPDRNHHHPIMTTEPQESNQQEATTTTTSFDDTCCAVCLEDYQEDSHDTGIILLPCQHSFHQDCILPWLTQRQAKCPLCKYDLLLVEQQLQQQASYNDNEELSTSNHPETNTLSWWLGWLNFPRRILVPQSSTWTRIMDHQQEEEVELTEQPLTTDSTIV